MRETLRELVGEGLLQNAMALWTVQFFRKTIPLITIPYLARVLGPEGWGLVAIFQSLAACLALLMEFGFELSATRQVARCRQSRERLAEVIAGVFGAQATMAAGAGVLTLLASQWGPILRQHQTLAAFCLLLAVADGCNPTWFFVGMERMGVVAAVEIGSKSAAAVAIFVLIRSEGDVTTVLALQGVAHLAGIVVAVWIMSRQAAFRLPSPRLIREALTAGWPMFVMRSAESLYGLGNAFILGFFASPTVVGYFAGPEKITRALAGLSSPIRQTLYPRLSRLLHTAPEKGARLARLGMTITMLSGLATGVGIFVCAPLLVRIVLGPQFAPAVTVLRLLAILPPLLAVMQSVGMQWLLPLGREQVVSRTVLAAGVLNLLLVLVLVPPFKHVGMAWAVLCSEAFVAGALIFAVRRDGQHKFLVGRCTPAVCAGD